MWVGKWGIFNALNSKHIGDRLSRRWDNWGCSEWTSCPTGGTTQFARSGSTQIYGPKRANTKNSAGRLWVKKAQLQLKKCPFLTGFRQGAKTQQSKLVQWVWGIEDILESRWIYHTGSTRLIPYTRTIYSMYTCYYHIDCHVALICTREFKSNLGTLKFESLSLVIFLYYVFRLFRMAIWKGNLSEIMLFFQIFFSSFF